VDVAFTSRAGDITVCRGGCAHPFSEEAAKRILLEEELTIKISAGTGPGSAAAWGCDLSYEYVRINGDYRS
jgi:glutamate N-acetyltransferase/amino-acid N-acetyltransferase